jgi:hypothetical protein
MDALLPRKSAPDSTSQPDWVVRGTHLSFSPNTFIEAVCLSQAPIDSRLLGLSDPYHQHAIGMFNTCSRIPTPRSLTDTGGGYHIETSEYPQHSPRSSLLSVSLIPLNGPVRSPFDPTLISNNSECISTYCRHVVFQPLVTYQHLYLCLANSNNL